MRKLNLRKNKKGISVMIGYVLLISFAVIMGTIVYQWIKTYVPREGLECPDGVSLFMQDYTYDCSSDVLSLTLMNNGRFNIGGYFIRATNDSNQELATKDLSLFWSGVPVGNVVRFLGGDNSFKPDDSPEIHVFNLGGSSLGTIYSVEIIPVRWQVEENRKQLVSCGNARVSELVFCS